SQLFLLGRGRFAALRTLGLGFSAGLRPFGAILGSAPAPPVNPEAVERAADDVITDAGRSFTRPPRTSTIECSCKLCPSPGIYAITSCPFVRRTLATFRSAEFGFFGVRVITCTQTPRRCGQLPSAGDFDFVVTFLRPLRTSWLIVGIKK